MTSARDITEKIRPPRAVFLDYPLRNVAGKPHDPDDQKRVLKASLILLQEFKEGGSIIDLPFVWDTAVNREWEKDIRAIYCEDKGRKTLINQRKLGENL